MAAVRTRFSRIVAGVALGLLAGPGAGWAASTPASPAIGLGGSPVVVFAAPRDQCDGDDVPDAPLRAFRTDHGTVRAFGLHTENRGLAGPDLLTLRIDCRPALVSHGNPDPAGYDDQRWVAATWTPDGRAIAALVHHEYQGNEHPGRCRFTEYLACWFNTVLGASSTDGGALFRTSTNPAVVASAPFKQDVDQGRQRGFFNPSNIVTTGSYSFFMASTTGWDGQPSGVCLFRTGTPADLRSWRAYDGFDYTIRYSDPYRSRALPRYPCAPVAPFQAPVGSLVRQRSTGTWVAVFQAKADARLFPVPGFYTAASRDLVNWSAPRLLLQGFTLYDDPCKSGGQLISYPSILDPADPSRNFDATGDHPDLFYVTLAVQGCEVTGRRTLLRRTLSLPGP